MTKIGDLFKKDIHRDINGVIKVGQRDERHIRQELEEYIVTRELRGHFQRFFDFYTETLNHPTDKIGVWISGFFGSGKSHFLKILSYLLDNREIGDRPALRYFEEKIEDPMLWAAMERAGQAPADVILFNIDSKADSDSKNDKDAIVTVLKKVFDEHQGYFGTSPALADFERRIDQRGKYQAFKDAYQEITGNRWVDHREGWTIDQDEIVEALQQALGMSEQAAWNMIDTLEAGSSTSPEQFAGIVKAYLDTKPADHRVIFMADEVGQYVGSDSDLMLNLQTVAEDLGTYCDGRAWIVVTSQEDMDRVTGGKIKGDDFSKIQGRFNPRNRISLSSANTDEVIQLRLLEKKESVEDELRRLYQEKDVTLSTQIRFSDDTANMPGFKSEEQFVTAYPFIPYQFKLLQTVFTQVRTMGASGKHLASGERSMLDAFQLGAQELDDAPLGTLAPFHLFYSAIENFLDTAVSRVIANATENPRLRYAPDDRSDPYATLDIDLLKTLFMVKYLKEIKTTVDNLVTLTLGHIDQDRTELKKQIEAALERLERETLIQRNGDEYSFLTNEEQDVGREIKATDVTPSEVTAKLNELFWVDVVPLERYRHDGRHSYRFNRKFDEATYGHQTADLTVEIVSAYHDEYAALQEDANAFRRTGPGGNVLLRLAEDPKLFEEMRRYLQTEKYVRSKSSGSLSESVRQILAARSQENVNRQDRVRQILRDLTTKADVFVAGAKLEPRQRDPRALVEQGLERLVTTTYKKLDYVQHHYESEGEVERVLRAGSELQDLEGKHPNAQAQSDVQAWLRDEERYNRPVVTIRRLLEKFQSAPYGWSEFDALGVLAELASRGDAELRVAQGPAKLDPGIVKALRSREGQDRHTVQLPRTINPVHLRFARKWGEEYLDAASLPNDPKELFDRMAAAMRERLDHLDGIAEQARDGYPFRDAIERSRRLLRELLGHREPAALFERLKEHEDDADGLIDDEHKILPFYRTQLHLFEGARERMRELETDAGYLQEADLRAKLERAREILAMPDPTREIRNLKGLLDPVEEGAVDAREARKGEALAELDDALGSARRLADERGLPDDARNGALARLQALRTDIECASGIDAVIARRTQIAQRSGDAKEAILNWSPPAPDDAADDPPAPQPRAVVLRFGELAERAQLRSEADVDRYLNRLRARLLERLEQADEIYLE